MIKFLILILILSCFKVNKNRIINLNKDEISIELVYSFLFSSSDDLFEESLVKVKDINKLLQSGKSLLHEAVSLNDITKIEILLKKGASTLLSDVKGKNPALLAKSGEVKKLLFKYQLKEELEIAIKQKEIDVINILIKRIETSDFYFPLISKILEKEIVDKETLVLIKEYLSKVSICIPEPTKELFLFIDDFYGQIQKLDSNKESDNGTKFEKSKTLSYMIKREKKFENKTNYDIKETKRSKDKENRFIPAINIENQKNNENKNEDINIQHSLKDLGTIKCLEIKKLDDKISSLLSKNHIKITYLNSNSVKVTLEKIKKAFLSYENWKNVNIIEDEIIIYKKNGSYYLIAIYPVNHNYSLNFNLNNREVLLLNFNTEYSFVKDIKNLDKWPGLVNIDNTCFLNSFLKAFSAISSINEILETEDLSTGTNIDREERLKFLRCFKSLVSAIRQADKSALNDQSINKVLIEKFVSYFNYLSKKYPSGENFLIGSNSLNANDNGFRDVSEFIRKFNSFIGNLSRNTGIITTKVYDKNLNCISGEAQNQILGNTFSLNILVGSINRLTIQNLVDSSNYHILENVEYNGIRANKHIFINEFPDFLIVELKRFTQDGRRINDEIEISKDLIVKSIDERGNISVSRKFILKSTIEHKGDNLNGYHYISHIFNNGIFENDDSRVSEIVNFNSSKETYILIYEKE